MTINIGALDTLLKKFRECLESEFADGFLTVLLDAMAVALLFNPEFKRNIKGFEARYLFRARDGSVDATAIFRHSRMEVWPTAIAEPKPNITITFSNGKALMQFLLARNPDILGSMLRQEVSLEGNLNYLYKLAYMARHLQLMAAKAL